MTATTRSASGALERGWLLGVVIAASVVFRLPALLHASETNADAAVVGLQAMHMLHGEWSPFLWGSGYQSSVDSAFAAAVFALFGASARALVASSLTLHLALTALAWSVIARRLGPLRASLCVLPLVFTSSPSQTYILYPPRQAALTIAMGALWAFDRAADGGQRHDLRRLAVLACGAALLGLACFADPYAIVLVPPIAAFGVACAITRAAPRASVARVTALLAGGLVGAAPAAILRLSHRATHGQLALSFGAVTRNARLLVDPCLAWMSGARAWSAANASDYVPWHGPLLVRGLSLFGGALFVAAVAAGGLCVFARSVPWGVRRLAIAGGLALPVTVLGFLVSPMVMDLFSARYLAAIPLLAPFALAPLAQRLRLRPFAMAMALCAFASGVAGWVGYGPFLRSSPAGAGHSEEAQLEHALAARGVQLATADYWTAYRLTFLTGERLVVVPTNPAEDRYEPYRARFEAAPAIAYIFDPVRSREPSNWIDARIDAGMAGYSASDLEIVHAGRFRAVILKRDYAPASGGGRLDGPRGVMQ